MMKLNFYKVNLSLQEEVGSDNYLFFCTIIMHLTNTPSNQKFKSSQHIL